MRRRTDHPPAEEARDTAFRILKRREHSRVELAEKLRSRGFDEETVARVVRDLASRGLLSDERFAEVRARARFLRGYGPAAVAADLRARGIGREAADECVTRFLGDTPEEEVVRKALAPTAWGRGKRTAEARRQAYSRLIRRGFSPALIRRILSGPTDVDDQGAVAEWESRS